MTPFCMADWQRCPVLPMLARPFTIVWNGLWKLGGDCDGMRSMTSVFEKRIQYHQIPLSTTWNALCPTAAAEDHDCAC